MHTNDVQNARQMIVADEKRYKDELWGELLAEANHREGERRNENDKRGTETTIQEKCPQSA